jgi:inner membrane protein
VPTVFSHPAVALLQTWFPRLPPRAIAIGAALTVLPDVDVVAFPFGIPYAAPLGHRGFTHSIAFALLAAALAAALLRSRATFAFFFLCAVSHTVFDAMTTGGLGVAFFAPFSNERYFLPWRPIRVAPINPERFFSARGLAVLGSELLWVWVPCAAAALVGRWRGTRRA